MIDSSGSDANQKFMMGEFEAEFPVDFQYAKNHMWAIASPEDPSLIRFGFAAYAVRLLQDVYFLDWLLDAPSQISESQEIGSIESKKAESALFAPCGGELLGFNVKADGRSIRNQCRQVWRRLAFRDAKKRCCFSKCRSIS